MRNLNRHWSSALLAVLGALWLNAAAVAQTAYPNRAVTLVVGFGPGSFPDVTARILAQKLSEKLGQSFVVENRVGAGGNVASEFVARSKPDGYTLIASSDSQWAVAVSTFKSLKFDPVKDFAPVAAFSSVPLYIAVNSKLPVSNFDEFVKLIQSNPGKYNYGTPGVGLVHHLAFETIKQQLGLKVEHVPYRGSSQLMPALLSGEIMIGVQAYRQLAEHVQKGTLKALASTAGKRSALAPNVPTVKELGVKGVAFAPGSGILAPANTPAPIVSKLASALKEIMADPETIKRFLAVGGEVDFQGPKEFAPRILEDVAKYAKAVKFAGIKPR
jgi:tripartite-type tricarboxylate transporter receptor subunit TctC